MLAALFPDYTHVYHCAGRLDGMEVALVPVVGAGSATHTVIAWLGDGETRRFPNMPEEMARRAFWETVHALNAQST